MSEQSKLTVAGLVVAELQRRLAMEVAAGYEGRDRWKDKEGYGHYEIVKDAAQVGALLDANMQPPEDYGITDVYESVDALVEHMLSDPYCIHFPVDAAPFVRRDEINFKAHKGTADARN